jgi:hypothetical protein
MPKSKKRGGAKKHKQRVKARNDKRVSENKRMERIQREMFNQIMLEKESGAFDEDLGLTGSNSTESNDIENNGGELEL